MLKVFFNVPSPVNEPVKSYAAGSAERKELQAMLATLRSQQLDIPMYIGAEEVRTDKTRKITPPHDHQHTLGFFHEGDSSHVEQAIQAALGAKEAWENMAW